MTHEIEGANNFTLIRSRILIAIGLGILVATVVGMFILQSMIRHLEQENFDEQIEMTFAMYQQIIADDTETISAVITLLQGNKKLQNTFVSGDRESLLAQSEPIFVQLRDKYQITHFYYHLASGQNFLRVHMPDRHGDVIKRYTMGQAMATNKLSAGIELGPLGTFTLRVVIPWERDGKVVGYLELGQEIDDVTHKIANMMPVDMILLIHKDVTTKEGWLQGQKLMGHSGNWDLLTKHALLNTSLTTIPPGIISYLQKEVDTKGSSNANFQVGTDLLASFTPLRDVTGQELGNFVVVVDISDSNSDLRKAFMKYVICSLFLLTVIMAAYWAYLGRIEQSIGIGREKLADALDRQERESEKLENILTTMAEGFILTMPSGQKIIQVNNKMIEMLGVPGEQISGRPIHDFISAETLPVAKEMIAQLNSGESDRCEIKIINNEGRLLTCLVTAAPMFDPNGIVIGSFSTWNDISEYKENINRLQEIENNFNRVFYHAEDAIALIKGGFFASCNEAFVKMLNAASKEEVINIQPGALSPDKQPDGQFSKEKALVMIEIAMERGFYRFEWLHRKINGELFPVEVSLTVLQNNGEVELHCRWKDLSRQKDYERNLQQAAIDALAASHSKDEFLANMSHEIRTPMNAIIGFTRLTLDEDIGEKQRERLENTLYSAENLLGILNDILDLSKIEAGQLTLDLHHFGLEAMMDHLRSTLLFQASEKQLVLVDSSEYSTLPKFIKGDELRLRQIIINLVSNSIKFTQTGRITMSVVVDHQDDDDSFMLHFSVEDTGIGIAADKQQTIFNSFSQADATTARKFGGTGLGLTISKQLVELMGGKIWLTSEENRGTIFHFTVRLAAGIAPQVKSGKSPVVASIRELRILLVEDNKFNQDVAVEVLEKDGHKVVVADDGLMALNTLLKQSFDVVFMDVQMPILDGLITTDVIRSCEEKRPTGLAEVQEIEDLLIQKLAGARIPIIAMTANAMSGDRQKCLDAGMDEYLTKPFMPEHIHEVLSRIFTNNNLPSKIMTIPRLPEEQNRPEEHSSLVGQVVHHLKTVYSISDETLPTMIKGAGRSFQDTLKDFSEAVKTKDIQAQQKAAHKTKGALLNMGLVKLGEQAKSIEKKAASGTAISHEDAADFVKSINYLIAEIEDWA